MTLACESTCALTGELLVHTVHKAYLTTTDTYVTCRYVHVRPNVLVELCDISLAEAHDLALALTLWREVRATLATTHRKSREGILEGLLEAEELERREVHRVVETRTTLVRANGIVELYAVTEVDLDLTLVVYPGDTEGEDTVGLDEALDDLVLLKLWMLVVNVLDRKEDLTDSLDELRLAWMLCL